MISIYHDPFTWSNVASDHAVMNYELLTQILKMIRDPNQTIINSGSMCKKNSDKVANNLERSLTMRKTK